MSVLTRAKRIITTIILPGDPEVKKKRAISALLKDISRQGPTWYDPWNNRVSRVFSTELAKLAEACKRMDRVFKKTLNGGPELFLGAENSVVDSVLSESAQSLSGLSFDAIRQIALTDTKNPPLQTLDRLFKERMLWLHSESLKQCAAGFKMTMILAALCRFTFDETIAIFHPGPAVKGREKEVKKNVPAESMIHQIEDLHFLLAGLKLDEYARNIFLQLHRCAAIIDYAAEQAAADFDAAAALISAQLDPLLLQRTIKAVCEDPFMEFAVYSVDIDIRKDVGTRLMQIFNERRNIMQKKTTEDGIEMRMHKVFGDMAIPSLKGWGRQEELKLVSAGLPALSGILTFSLVKSFLKIFYAPALRVAISEAIMDLDFCDTQFRFNLSDEADEMGALVDELREFEESVEVPGHSQYAMVLGSIRGTLLDATVKLPHRKIIAEANLRAEALIQKIFSKTRALSARLSSLRDDLKNGSCIYVNKILGGDTKKAMRAKALMDAAQKILFLHEILKHTAVDIVAAERIIGQRSVVDA